jgi:hypothetical protein
MFAGPDAIPQINEAAAERASPECSAFAQWRFGNLFAHASAARLQLVLWHDRGHAHLSKKHMASASPPKSQTRYRRRYTSDRAAIVVHIVTVIAAVKPADRRARLARAFCLDGFALARAAFERLLFS